MNSNELGVSTASATARAGGRAPPWLLWPRHGSPAEGIPALERRKKKEGSHASRLRRQKAVLFPVFQSAELIAAHKLLPICCWSLKCNNAHGYEEGAPPPPHFYVDYSPTVTLGHASIETTISSSIPEERYRSRMP